MVWASTSRACASSGMTPAMTAREKASTADSIANSRAPGRSTTRNHIGKRISKEEPQPAKKAARPRHAPALSQTDRPVRRALTRGQSPHLSLAHTGRHPGQASSASASRGLWRDQTPVSPDRARQSPRSEDHTSELQSLMRISYAVFCLKKKTHNTHLTTLSTPT